MSFAHFLVKKVYPERYGSDDQPSLVIPHQYGAVTEYVWDLYYKVRIHGVVHKVQGHLAVAPVNALLT